MASSLVPFGGKLLLEMPGQREIDVVAAEQHVFTYRHALERQFAGLLGDRDQREIGGAAADVHHQNQIAHRHALAPVRMPFDPGVKRGLRLFQQQQILVSGLFGGLQRKLARHRVKRRRHRHQHLLLDERARPPFSNPRPRADAPDTGATPPPGKPSPRPPGAFSGRIGRGAIDAGMRQPRFRRSHQPAGHLGAAFLRQRPGHVNAAIASQGSAMDPAGKSEGPGRYKNDGSSGWSRTSPGFTNCGTSNSATGGRSRGSPPAGA